MSYTFLHRGRIPSLDGLRAVAILMVIAFHASHTTHPPAWAVSILDHGQVGVDIFFVISGFLITTLLLRERGRNGNISLRAFYLRRARRILPAFAAYLITVATLQAAGYEHIPGREWIGALTYTINFQHLGWTPLSHVWSLSIEEHFYLVWPLLFLLFASRSAWMAILALAISPLLRFWLHFHTRMDVDFITPTRLDGIASGCLLAIIAQTTRGRTLLEKLEERPGAHLAILTVVYAASVLVLSRSGKYDLTVRRPIEAMLVAALLWLVVRFDHLPLARSLNWKPVALMGIGSYSLYLWQQLFLEPRNGQNWMCRFPQNVAIAFLVGFISYRFIETPFLRIKDRIGANRHGRVEETVSVTCPPRSFTFPE